MNNANLNNEYKKRLSLIEVEIDKILPKATTKSWIKTQGGEGLQTVTTKEADLFNAPAYNLVSRGGKRWRPMLMLLSSELAGYKHQALPLTPVVELPHNGSLIIDDIEDGSDLRRGKPSAHIEFGTDRAINAGNLIYYLPTTLIRDFNCSPKTKVMLYDIYNQNMRRLHFGQGLDIQWHNDKNHIPSAESYKTMCRLKTGSLAKMAAEIGHAIKGKKSQKSKTLASIAENIGVGFQIADDIINLRTGNPGKKRGDDIIEQKRSLPFILHCTTNKPEKLLSLTKNAHKLGIEKGEQYIIEAINLMEDSGAIQMASDEAYKIMDKCKIDLEKSFPNCEARDLIQLMIEGFKIP